MGHRQVKPIPPFAKTAKSGAPAKSETQLRSGIARGSPVSCDAEDARKKGGPPAYWMAKSWPEASGTNDERQKSRQDAGATRETAKKERGRDGSQALEACAAWKLWRRLKPTLLKGNAKRTRSRW